MKNILTNIKKSLNLFSPLRNSMEKMKWRRKCLFSGKKSVIRSTEFAGYNMIGSQVTLIDCKIGVATYINDYSKFYRAKIGNYCSIADHVISGFGQHPMDRVSTHPAFVYDTTPQIGWTLFDSHFSEEYNIFRTSDDSDYIVEVGDDVWIGSHVLLMDGIKIGTGAVVAAGAVVTKDVPPYAVVGGVPAKILKYRHNDIEREKLLKSKWWDKTPDEMKEVGNKGEIGGVGFYYSKK